MVKDMITTEEAREMVNKSGLFTVIPLLSEHVNSNDEYIYKVVDEEIRRAASNGYLSMQIMIASIFPFDKAISVDHIIGYFGQHGYYAKFGDVVINDSVVVGKYTVRLEIGWR